MPYSEGIGSQTAEAINSLRVEISRRVLDLHYHSKPEYWEKYGEEGRRLCLRDIDTHLSYLIEALALSDPSLFQHYLLWVKGLFDNLGLPGQTVPDMLAHFKQAMQELLPEIHAPNVAVLLEQAAPVSKNFRDEGTMPETDEPSLTRTAREYIDALLREDRDGARQLILASSDAGVSIQEIYQQVLQPALREIGRLWYSRQISVAEEHFCTASTQLIMSALYPRIFNHAKTEKRLVAACPEGELHEIGVRMVADFFEMEAWDTYYLGANMPVQEIVNVISAKRPHVLAISATIPVHLSTVARLVSKIKALPLEPPAKIIVGGGAFARRPELFQEIGAHGYADDAEDAVNLVNDLLKSREP